MDLGGVRRKMARKNCERINAVKTVTFFKKLVYRRTTGFFQRYGNFILMPAVHHFIVKYFTSREQEKYVF